MHDSYIAIAVIVITALILKELFVYVIGKIIKKVDADYITVHDCKSCKDEKIGDMKEFKKEMREKLSAIAGILLVMATGKKVPAEQTEKFMEKLMGVSR